MHGVSKISRVRFREVPYQDLAVFQNVLSARLGLPGSQPWQCPYGCSSRLLGLLSYEGPH